MGAKAIQISNDGGTIWNTLPGSEGNFNADGEAIEDTILGQIFASAETGLTMWGISSNAIWKGYPGYQAKLLSAGTPTTMTDEAMGLVSGLTYQVTDTARRIIDRSATVVIEDNSVAVAAADIESVDYLFGKVTFVAGYSVTGPITMTADYMTTAVVGCTQSYTLTMTADMIDETCFSDAQANNGRKIFRSGLKTVALELTGVYYPTGDYKTQLINRNEFIIEIDPTGTGNSLARGFFKLATEGHGGAVGALEEETLNFNLYVPDETVNPYVEFPFAWQHTGSTNLNQAVRDLLDSWEQGLNTYDVRYLPQGTPTQTPLDGVSGDFVAADISLSGSLDSMNVFQAELQGTGAFTVI